MEYRIEPAHDYGIEVIFEMLKDAALWLRSRNIDYWQNWLHPSAQERAWIAGGFDAGEFYVVKDGSDIVGMFRLAYEDELFWGKRGDRAGYVHSLTTSRKRAGTGVGTEILQMIEERLRRENVEYLRLDCGDVPGLYRYYERQGFVRVDTRECFGFLAHFYEKRL